MPDQETLERQLSQLRETYGPFPVETATYDVDADAFDPGIPASGSNERSAEIASHC